MRYELGDKVRLPEYLNSVEGYIISIEFNDLYVVEFIDEEFDIRMEAIVYGNEIEFIERESDEDESNADERV